MIAGGLIYEYEVELYIGKPEDVSDRIPSLLGQDIPKRWRMAHHLSADRLEFQPVDADYTIQ